MENEKSQKEQQYDNYWKLTVEYSDIHGVLFYNILNSIVKFIDENDFLNGDCTIEQYKKLQNKINQLNPKKDMGSVRKSINQFIKLGFVKPKFKGYHKLTKQFLRTNDEKERELIFTQIFYESASLNSSYNNDSTDSKEVNFLLKTLEYNGKLTKNDLMGLMVTDVSKFSRGYLKQEELNLQYQYALSINFDEKKYNQINYLIRFLKYMPDLSYKDGILEFTDGKCELRADMTEFKRDPILMRIYRKKLFDESQNVYGRIVCYACKLPWKALVASHIKPLAECLKEQKTIEAYNKDNGLLLSPNVDAYFDKFDISFDENGKIMMGRNVDAEIVEVMKDYCLDSVIMTKERMEFMEYHRNIYRSKQ